MAIDPIAEYLRDHEVIIEWAGCTFEVWYEGPYDTLVFIWSPQCREGLDIEYKEGVAMARLMCSGTGTGDALATLLGSGYELTCGGTIIECFSATDRDEIEVLARAKAAEELKR